MGKMVLGVVLCLLSMSLLASAAPSSEIGHTFTHTCASIKGVCLPSMSFIHCTNGADSEASCPYGDQQYCCTGL
ncbi:hypothetical protein ACOMHN_015341 [Nucella lapillus]